MAMVTALQPIRALGCTVQTGQHLECSDAQAADWIGQGLVEAAAAGAKQTAGEPVEAAPAKPKSKPKSKAKTKATAKEES